MYSVKKVFLEILQNSQKNTHARVFLNKVVGLRLATLLRKRLAEAFSCEFCKISKNTFSYRTPPLPASVWSHNLCEKGPLTWALTWRFLELPELQFLRKSLSKWIYAVNLFHVTGLILYPLKTSENQRFSDVIRGYRRRPVTWNRLMLIKSLFLR